jgi:DNA-binding response OmpR family regulator
VVHPTPEDPSLLRTRLRASDFEVSWVRLGRSVVDDVIAHNPDVVVIDHAAANFDVTRACRDISASLSARVLVIFADDVGYTEQLETEILDSGADDFMRASTSTALLIARIRASLRRRPTPILQLAQLAIGDVIIDLQAHALLIGGASVKCSPLQFSLLAVLAERVNQVVRRETLLVDVWACEPSTVDPRRVRIAISSVRRVLGSGPHRPRIETVPHVGYRLTLDEVPATAA